MGKLFCLLGKSGTGKDTVFRALADQQSLNLRLVVGYTTRPRREFEIEGVEYHFVSETAFAALREAGKIIEERCYQTMHGVWRYATVDDGSVDLSTGQYLMIATPEAIDSLRAHFGGTAVVPLYLEVEDGLRLRRMLRREGRREAPDYREVCRRFLADEQDFDCDVLLQHGISKGISNRRLQDCVTQITEIIVQSSAPTDVTGRIIEG
ncbi:guanylate kinase [Ethanoligenens sp.]|uniref:guanylate kinase n=1 Tax=Ethanoligenens sp. TaxID=2099655 RepID=UPI0039E9C35B